MMLVEGKNIWRRSKARRAAVLNDGAAYFGALRSSLLAAQDSVFIIGWDIHSETPLVGPEGRADDGFPDTLGPFIQALLARRPSLHVHLLVWKAPLLYVGERQWFPEYNFGKQERLSFCFDECLPLGSAQHQKIVIVDDVVAFSGGCDLTIRRWDTDAHSASNPFRADPGGTPYPPFHDVQMVVDGEAARSLAELARTRWADAGCSAKPLSAPSQPPHDAPDRWPAGLRPEFEDVEIGIARTEPPRRGQPVVDEALQLFFAMIDAAEHSIYIENQFLSAESVAKRIARRMRQKPELEVLLVAPKTHASWLEARTMRNGRLKFMQILSEPDIRDRVRLLYPDVRDGDNVTAVMIHAKVMIVDDRMLRVGSANLNNRSFGADTECDLVIEARSDVERQAVVAIRDRLIAHHCGASAQQFAERYATSHHSLLAAARALTCGGHSLRPVHDGEADPEEISDMVNPIADPQRPLNLSRAAGTTRSAALKLIGLLVTIAALALAWRLTPLHQWLDLDTVSETVQALRGQPAAPLVVIAMFVAGGFLLFPVTVLIAATSAALGPWIGFGSASVGALTSASIIYVLGRWMGIEPVRSLIGRKLDRLQKAVTRNGIVSVVLIRMVPIAPFSLVNLAAGASGIRFRDFLIGTLLGMAPGLIAMSAFGAQLADIVSSPTWSNVAILAVVAVAWVALSFTAQFAVTWLSRRA